MPEVSLPNAIPLLRFAQIAEAQSTPFGCAFENGASHLGRHLSEGLQRLTFMLDSSNRHFNDPSPGSSRVDQQADIDAVIVLEAKLAQQTAPGRNNSAKRLREICKLWKVGPKQRSRGKRRHASAASAEACLHKVRLIGKQRPRHAANQILPQSAQITIQIK